MTPGKRRLKNIQLHPCASGLFTSYGNEKDIWDSVCEVWRLLAPSTSKGEDLKVKYDTFTTICNV